MANSSRVYKAISSLYKRAINTARELRDSIDDGWPPGGSGRGGGGLGRRPVPVRVPVPVSRNPYHIPRPSGSGPSSGQAWYAAESRRFASNIAIKRSQKSEPRFNSVYAKLSNIGHGTTFAHPFKSPRLTGGTLQRSVQGYSLPGFRARGSVRYFSYNIRPMADVIANLSITARAGGLESSRLYAKLNQRKQFSTQVPHIASVNDVESVSDYFSFADRSGFASRQRFVPESRVSTEEFDLAAIKYSQETVFLDFDFSPTFTFAEAKYNELTEEVIGSMAKSINNYMDDLRQNFTDIKTIADRIGALRVSVSSKGGTKVRVHFPDRTPFEVDRICQDMSIKRGMIRSEAIVQHSSRSSENWTQSFSSLSDEVLFGHTGWTPGGTGGINSEVAESEYSIPEFQRCS
ncbi:hypothetical protein V1512DRAFT_277194 [Lipomyces arxii]|uniref:uncharacterized protein n=1 Tax=Lipomyces arxii TaxID=56418 RepID=UPI0034CFA5E0